MSIGTLSQSLLLRNILSRETWISNFSLKSHLEHQRLLKKRNDNMAGEHLRRGSRHQISPCPPKGEHLSARFGLKGTSFEWYFRQTYGLVWHIPLCLLVLVHDSFPSIIVDRQARPLHHALRLPPLPELFVAHLSPFVQFCHALFASRSSLVPAWFLVAVFSAVARRWLASLWLNLDLLSLLLVERSLWLGALLFLQPPSPSCLLQVCAFDRPAGFVLSGKIDHWMGLSVVAYFVAHQD